jgi:hypothetical protein
MLQAIEQEQFSVLPGGVFNKGFVRAYAKHLGFNPEQSVAEYLTALRQAQLDEQTAAWDQSLPLKTTPPPTLQQKPSPPLSSDPRSALHELPLPQALVQPPPNSPPPLWVSPKSSALKERLSKERLSKERSPQQRSEERSTPPRPLERRYSEPIPLETKSPEPESLEPGSLEQRSPEQSSPQQNSLAERPVEVRAAEVRPSEIRPLEEKSFEEEPSPEKLLPPAMPAEVTPQHPRSQPTGPQILVADPPRPPSPTPRPISQKRPVAVPVTSTAWKTPALILTLAAIVIAALLSSRHSKSTPTSAMVPVNTSPQTQSTGTTTNSAPSNAPPTHSAAAPTVPVPSTKVSPARTQKTHAAKLPPPFRLSIRASENCFISITADGELVSRENLIAPANTSVKANHEIVVQVSNPTALTFHINDRSISAPASAVATTKTYIFDSSGLKASPQ